MEYLRGVDREQREVMPPSLDEVVAENNPVRVIDAFVEGLEASEIGFKREAPEWTGRRGYNPKDHMAVPSGICCYNPRTFQTA